MRRKGYQRGGGKVKHKEILVVSMDLNGLGESRILVIGLS